MFSLSALHLVHLHSSSPDQLLSQKFQQAATLHRTKALALFRYELQNLNEENAAAAAACSSFLSLIPWLVRGGKGKNIFIPSALLYSAPSSPSTHIRPPSSTSSETDPLDESRPIVPWYKLHRGGHQIVTMTYTWILHSPNSDLVDIVRPWIVVETDVALRVAKINLSPLPQAQPSASVERSRNTPSPVPSHLPAPHPSSSSASPLPPTSQNPIWKLGQSEPADPDAINDARKEGAPLTDEDHLLRLSAYWAPPNSTTPAHPTLSQTDITALDETLVTLRYVFSIVSPPHPPITRAGS
ncbi:hypothetical protein IFR04_012495 [Cadophora malorum]|uniref:Uncharacterized protein n=1 Tax=Cadophora malorum TaxID=108018 RepID=A0A8H7W6Q5_9HELO|nr:hypothetical protein IFR04_012495 [Cadophora malorum]